MEVWSEVKHLQPECLATFDSECDHQKPSKIDRPTLTEIYGKGYLQASSGRRGPLKLDVLIFLINKHDHRDTRT